MHYIVNILTDAALSGLSVPDVGRFLIKINVDSIERVLDLLVVRTVIKSRKLFTIETGKGYLVLKCANF